MRTGTEGRSAQIGELNENEPIELIPEEEDAPCNEYVVMSEQRHMPALQEYLHELHADGVQALQ